MNRAVPPVRPRWSVPRRLLVVGTTALLAAGLTATATAPAQASAPRLATASGTISTAKHDVLANLFEWNWPSVAKECRSVLGPSGYGGVQVAPPQDSVKRTALGNGSDTVLHPWWEVYQPTDYRLTSRMGTEAQFRSMVTTCRASGVKVYVDAVINHATGQGSTSYGGTTFTKYDYPGVWSPSDFHSYPGDCPVAPAAGSSDREGSIADFNDYTQVFNCELVGLADLNTRTAKVRDTLAAYLNKLIGYGVSGFRVDAAKHIGQTDLAAIERKLHRTKDGTRPYLALEVFPGGPGRLAPAAFEQVGDLLGFDYAYQLHDAFKSYSSPANDGNIGDLLDLGAGLLGSSHELVFAQNHDTERDGSTLNYKDPDNTIADEFMLAYGYGTPEIYAGFAFGTDTAASPPSDSNGLITNTDCAAGTWICIDRYTRIRHLVAFHDYVAGSNRNHPYSDGTNLIAFSRGSRGFFAVSNETAAKTVTVRTALKPGRYCDVVDGAKAANHCTGTVVRVRSNGTTTIRVPKYGAVAFTAADRLH